MTLAAGSSDTPARDWYFTRFEKRRPLPPSPHVKWRETLWQVMASMSLGIGLWYFYWRWTASLNMEALWFAIPLALAETLSFIGLLLLMFNMWQISDTPWQPPPTSARQCDPDAEDRPVKVDVYITTYSEDPELVRLSLQAARSLVSPPHVDIAVYCLDDGRRPEMRQVAEAEGCGYLTRSSGEGFKAGNLRNALDHTSGDFVIICDADTRIFPQFVERTLGYFRDPDIAWVQTPQWFFDLPEGESLEDAWERRGRVVGLGKPARWAARAFQRLFGPVRVGEDPFDNSPVFFYDVLLRRRNGASASFCCGAGSIHRREAVLQASLRAYAAAVERRVTPVIAEIDDAESRETLGSAMRREMALETQVTPYKFHVSEDIYTSIVLQGDPVRPWRSVFHPEILSKMLSPQDMQSWLIQRFKYGAGTIDITVNDNPLLNYKLTLSQKLMYLMTIWSWLSCLWMPAFLLAPIIYLFTGIPPVTAFSLEFFAHFIPYIFAYELAVLIGAWGVSNGRGSSFHMAFFPYGLRAIWTVLRGEPIKFPITPKERQIGRFLHLVKWQILVIVLTVLAIAWATIAIFVLGWRTDVSGYIVNVFWGTFCIMMMMSIVRAALWRPVGEGTT
ncbi:MAG TPA: glycosyltransferase [Vineibacter sp.]|nr:glycosyltransferase [Vineibacter sp.]